MTMARLSAAQIGGLSADAAAGLTLTDLAALTTNQGVQIPDNHNSLKAGVRGPTLLEDFIMREKITHFDPRHYCRGDTHYY